MTRHISTLWTMVALSCLAGVPAGLAAQQIQGTLVAAETETVLPFGLVELLDGTLSTVATAFADELGRFALLAPGPGQYALRASHMNAHPLISGAVELAADQIIVVELTLSLKAIELDSLLVSVPLEYRPLVRAGFYERARNGFGTFIPPDAVERMNPFRTTDLLRRMPGVRLEPDPNRAFRYKLTFTRASGASRGGNQCSPKIVVDDQTMIDFDLDDLAPQTVFAIEVYKNQFAAPARYGGADAACGVIVIWTGARLPRGRQ